MIRGILAVTLCLSSFTNLSAASRSVRQVLPTQHVLDARGVAMFGFDPVSYHLQTPTKGKEHIRVMHKGATFLFSSEANRNVFLKFPAKYSPAFGGYCAYAISKGEKMPADPQNYKIINGQTHLFFKNTRYDAKKVWERKSVELGETALLDVSSKQWDRISRL